MPAIVLALALAAGMAQVQAQIQAGAAGSAAAVLLPPVAEGAALPGGPASDRFEVSRFRFEGQRSLGMAELEALAAPFLKRPIRLADLEELRQRITRAYIDRGQVSSGALLPADAFAQYASDGSVRVLVIEGVVTQLRLQGLGRLDTAYVGSRLLHSGEVLDTNRLQERFRLLLADPLFQSMNARLLPGAQPGQATLEVDVTRAAPLQISLFANNHLAPAVGSSVGGIEATLRNLSGWGDSLVGTLSRSGGSDSHDLAWTLPLAARSTTLGLHLARANSSVIEEPLKALDVDSVVDTRELTLGHPFIDESRRKLTLGLSWSQRRNRTTIGGEPFSFVAGENTGTTEVRAWRLFQELVLRFDAHVLALRSTFVNGRNNLPSADAATAALPTQPDPSYRLWTGQVQASIATGDDGAAWVLRGQLQRSRNPLVPLEQMSLGGRHTVRGFRENQLVRDNGYALSVEYQWPLLRKETAAQSLMLVPFVDLGAASDHAGESRRLQSAGLGLQWAIAGLEAELFVARRLTSRPADTRGDLQDHGIHLSLRYRAF